MRERETERVRERETERVRERHTQREKERETERERDRERETERDRETETETERATDLSITDAATDAPICRMPGPEGSRSESVARTIDSTSLLGGHCVREINANSLAISVLVFRGFF